MGPFHAFFRLIVQAKRRDVAALAGLMLAASATDGLGLMLLVPLLRGIGASTQGPMTGPLGDWLGGLSNTLSLGPLLIGFTALVALRGLIQYRRDTLGLRLQNEAVDRLRQQAFAVLLGAEWRWLSQRRRSDHSSLLLTGISRIGMGMSFGISLMASAAAIGAYLVVAFLLSPGLAALALLTGIVVSLMLSRHRGAAYRLGIENSEANRALHGSVEQSLTGIRLAKILGTEARHAAEISDATRCLRVNQGRFLASTSATRGAFQVAGAAFLAVYIYLGLQVFAVALPQLLTLVLIFARLVPMLIAGQTQLHHWMNAMPALEETEALLREGSAAAEPADTGDPTQWPLTEAVEFKGVSVVHGDRAAPALAEVSLRLPVRKTTAIIGASGSGKSTFADVLAGLVPPDVGSVLVDGIPVTGADRRRWRRSVAYVTQETVLPMGSIRDVLRAARASATEQEMHAALNAASADFVNHLPDGLDTQVGDAGLRLSGGERQRLALARALLRRPEVLILDEATSALDPVNETRISDALIRLRGVLTLVIIGHRLPGLQQADQVVLLDGGRIRAQGTWEDVRPMAGPTQRE